MVRANHVGGRHIIGTRRAVGNRGRSVRRMVADPLSDMGVNDECKGKRRDMRKRLNTITRSGMIGVTEKLPRNSK